MKLFKKLGLIFAAFAFCLTVAISSSYAQPGKAKYEGNKGKHRGWTQGKHYGWNNRVNRRVNSREQRRIQNRQNQITRAENRFSRDGIISSKERRKLDKRYSKYYRTVRRARNH